MGNGKHCENNKCNKLLPQITVKMKFGVEKGKLVFPRSVKIK